MSRIKRVEIQEFAFELPDLGWDAGGFNVVYQPNNKLKLAKYAIAIEADDGARGEYVALWGGTKMALGQTLALAPHLLGRVSPVDAKEVKNDTNAATDELRRSVVR